MLRGDGLVAPVELAVVDGEPGAVDGELARLHRARHEGEGHEVGQRHLDALQLQRVLRVDGAAAPHAVPSLVQHRHLRKDMALIILHTHRLPSCLLTKRDYMTKLVHISQEVCACVNVCVAVVTQGPTNSQHLSSMVSASAAEMPPQPPWPITTRCRIFITLTAYSRAERQEI